MTVTAPNAPFLGAGIGYRRAHRQQLLAAAPDERPAFLELMPEHVFGAPAEAELLASHYPIVVHAVGLSLGTTWNGGPEEAAWEAYVARVADIARRSAARYVSDHVALTKSPAGIDVGHLVPLPYTDASLRALIDRIRIAQDKLRLPLLLENIARPFTFGAGELPEPEFFHRLIETTGCGMLLDVTNLLYNGRNLGFAAETEIQRYPLHAVRTVHVAGGVAADDGFWLDTHSRPPHDDSLALLAGLRGRAPLEAIVVERDSHLPPLRALVNDARRAEQAWLWQDGRP